MYNFLLHHLLSFAIWLPIVFGIAVLCTADDNNPTPTRCLALLGSVLGFALTLVLYALFDATYSGFQFGERTHWIPSFNIHYRLGIDGIALPLILLTSLTTVIVVLSSWRIITQQVAQYMAAFLIMSGLMIGVFCALDAMLFYVFWEAMLIPLFLIVGIWGGPRRVYAAIKFFLYTLAGSLLMLVAFIYLHQTSGSFDLNDYYQLHLPLGVQILLFLAFFAAFAVKIPMWPVHTWLPDAHVEAPTAGSVVLAAVALKLGGYGFLRFAIPIAPDAAHYLSTPMLVLSLIAIIYIALVALVQQDLKKLIAYSSISHMGFVTLGFFMFNQLGLEGAMMQMVSHGLISAALFLCVGVLYERVHSREISAYGGVVNTMPIFATLAVFFAMSNSGLPATSGFVGEFMIILGAMQLNFWLAALAALTLIFGAAYNLWMVKRVFFGDIANPQVAALTDLSRREFAILAVLAALVLALGLYPQALNHITAQSVSDLLQVVGRRG